MLHCQQLEMQLSLIDNVSWSADDLVSGCRLIRLPLTVYRFNVNSQPIDLPLPTTNWKLKTEN